MFYPSKFALITDILDNFGRMVFERIAEKGDIRWFYRLKHHFSIVVIISFHSGIDLSIMNCRSISNPSSCQRLLAKHAEIGFTKLPL